MRKVLALGLLAILVVVSCKKSSDAVKTGDAQEVAAAPQKSYSYSIDTASVALWWGYKIFDGEESGHNGNIQFKSGTVDFKGDSLTGAKVVLDMNTINSLDLNGIPDDKAKLDGHLKDKDFLDVAKYPEAKFEITDVKYTAPNHAEVSGNLTIKDVSKNLTVPADVSFENGRFKVHFPKFKINRKDWSIDFDMGLKDRAVKDDMYLEVFLEGQKS